MKLKQKVIIQNDNRTLKEVAGEEITIKGFPLTLIVHESLEGWEIGKLKVSEKESGCGMFTVKSKKLQDVKQADIEEELKHFLEVHPLEETIEALKQYPTVKQLQEREEEHE